VHQSGKLKQCQYTTARIVDRRNITSLHIVNPKPVPPKSRAVDESPCENGLKSFRSTAPSMPIPVSSTVKKTVRMSSDSVADADRVIVPLLVNLIALVSLGEKMKIRTMVPDYT
jgi:hypothetical protein